MDDMGGTQNYGPQLAAYLDRLRGEQSMRQFALAHGLDDATISRWRNGATPEITGLRVVADGLGVSLGDVLVAAGLARRSELAIRPERPVPSFKEATDPENGDPTLTEGERGSLRGILEAIRQNANPDGGRRKRQRTKK